MVRRESHIDVLFREGLKDMEVLPPAYLWDDIAPAVRSTSGKGIIYRIAAGVAVLTSLGIMSYYLATGSFSSLQNGIADAENISPDNPVRESFVASLDETNDVVNETAVREIIEEADMPDTEAPSKVAMAGFGETMVADAGSSKLRYDIIYENRNPKGIEFDNLESGFDPLQGRATACHSPFVGQKRRRH